MTHMKRTTISLPNELADRVFALRKDDRFTRCSYSELIRQLTEKGLSALEGSNGTISQQKATGNMNEDDPPRA